MRHSSVRAGGRWRLHATDAVRVSSKGSDTARLMTQSRYVSAKNLSGTHASPSSFFFSSLLFLFFFAYYTYPRSCPSPFCSAFSYLSRSTPVFHSLVVVRDFEAGRLVRGKSGIGKSEWEMINHGRRASNLKTYLSSGSCSPFFMGY